MNKSIPVFLLSIICALGSIAQVRNSIKGRVLHGETGAPIAGASVFITNTSKGTVSDSSGSFQLSNVPEGAYDLIISSIGFETIAHSYKAADLPLRLEVRMKPKSQELQNVVVEPDEKNGWERWGAFFIENFLGTNSNGKSCRIVNQSTLRFRFSKKRNVLTVIADEPLIIENKALGYLLKYQLEDFRFDFRTHVQVFYGYSLFSPLGKKGPSKRALKNREDAYNGSPMHFMRSLYHDSLQAEGFEVKRLVRRPNLEKQRVKEAFRRSLMTNDSSRPEGNAASGGSSRRIDIASGTGDSTEYYRRVLHQPDLLEEFGTTLLTADSLLTPTSGRTKSLFFTNYLYIVYRKDREAAGYLDYIHETRPAYFQRSAAFLPDAISISIEPTGNYYPPQSFMTEGYWAWDEKMGNLLPLDYKK